MKLTIQSIYMDGNGTAPIASLVEETLTDGSQVYNIELHPAEIPANSKALGENTMFVIAAILKSTGNLNVQLI